MEQLPLAMRLRERADFDHYVAGPNAAVVELLRDGVAGTRMYWLTGPAGVGKTHLLQAICTHALAAGRSALYLSLSELLAVGPEALMTWREASVIALDEVSLILGQRDWEQALFNVYREAEQRNAVLLAAAAVPPVQLRFALPDLASRCAAALLLTLRPLEEADQRIALQLRARARGLELPDDSARYLQHRFPRDLATLCRLLDAIDSAALQAQRRLTVPFIRAVLAPHSTGPAE